MGRRILVTRPQPGAARTAARLVDLGFTPVELPLTEIVGLPIPTLPDLSTFDAVAITSANALRHAPAEMTKALTGKPCFAVGAETAQTARRAGFTSVVDGNGTTGQLASAISATMPPGASVLYLCGRLRTIGLEAALEQCGLKVQALETYDAPAVAYGGATLDSAVGSEPIDAVLLYSARAAQLFFDHPWTDAARHSLNKANYLCLSAEIAGQLAGMHRDRIMVARQPTEDAMMRELAEHDRAPFQGKLV